MKNDMLRKIWLIAKTVLLESVRRKEIYAIVLLSAVFIAFLGSVRFFQIEGIGKFYRETALKIMSIATALTVIFLAARQLPREFESRTIYPLLAKPVSRLEFILGKFFGVMLAGAFCYLLFTIIFVFGILYLHSKINWIVYLQEFYLIMLMLGIVASLSFALSMILHLDAAITISALLFLLSQIITTTISYLYDYLGSGGKIAMRIFNIIIPQLTLFDLSAKIVHQEVWGPISFWAMRTLTIYAFAYILIFLAAGYLLFRRKAL